jgi:hypothetical protein
MCKFLIILCLASFFTSCTQVITIPVRTILDMPTKVERVRTTTTHDIVPSALETAD